MSPVRGSLRPFGVLVAASLLGGCGSSGGGASASSFAPGSSTPPGTAPQGYVNPAWQDPVSAPSATWPANATPDTALADWFFNRSWLADRSMWSSYMRNAQQPGRETLGAYGVGNGRVFGMVGLSYPLNTLHGMMGPSYQIGSDGYFGDFSLGLELYPVTVVMAEEWAWKPRRAAATITKARSDKLELYTVDFAPPGVDAICRIVIAKNISSEIQTDVRVAGRLLGGNAIEGNRLTQVRGGRHLTIGATGAAGGATVLGDRIRVPLGTLLPNEERAALVYCAISNESDLARRQTTINTVETVSPDLLLEATRAHWASFFANGASFELPDPKVQDFVDDMTVTVAVQIAENGCATPMSRYTKTWMRDQEGALRVFLRTGRPELVRTMLDGYYKTSIESGGIFNSMPVDVDVKNVNVANAPDWMTAEFMPGRIPVEAPSYIPIALYDYYTATGDVSILAEQYAYMKAAVLRQEVSPDGLMRFNGDEPFRWVLMLALGLYEPENRGWSSNSSFLFVAAADRMAKVATLLGKPADAAVFQQKADFVRAATERHFWLPVSGHYDVCQLFIGGGIPVGKPFEDISLMPLRLGYGDAKHPNVRRNVLTVKDLLGKPNGLVHSNAIINGFIGTDGMVPGYYLQNLAMIDHPDAELTFNAIGRFALCSGEIAEGQYATKQGAAVLQYHADGGPDVVARYRPWEGGIVEDAMLQYLVGESWSAPAGRVSLMPHMPNGWGSMAARGLECGGRTYDLEVRDFYTRRVQRVTNRSAQPLTVELGASVNGWSVGPVRLDGVAIPTPALDVDFGRVSFKVERTLQPGEWVDLDFDYVR